MDVFRFVPGYQGVIFDEGKEPLFLVLVAFVLAFACARGYARLARKHGWPSGNIGGVHLHHVVIGILVVLASGVVSFSRAGTEPGVRDGCAIAFGIGAAFILDEFALVFYLQDVYWSEEGRTSVDTAILGVMIVGLLLVVSEPFTLTGPLNRHPGRFIASVVLASNVLFIAITFLKRKPFAGMAAIALPPIGWIAAFRLASPSSPWAHRFYDAPKLERARVRMTTGRPARFQRRLVHLIGGE